jgi:cyclophilin family peptidyl-prolyl cis-trans isomerase
MDKKALVISLAVFVLLAGGIYFFFFPKLDKADKSAGNQTQENYNTDEQAATEPVAEKTDSQPAAAEATSTSATTTLETNIKKTMPIATIVTNKGTIKIELYQNDAPKAVENFITLAKKNFYDGVIFHRVISGFMIQGGDPTGTGRGGPGYQFEDELKPETESYKTGYTRGTVAMANSGPNTNGSQFFILHQDYPLPHNYTIFGHVISGQDVVDAIATSQTDGDDRPLSEVKMTKVTIEE